VSLRDFSWERMIAAVEEFRERARRAAAALEQAGIPHVIVGGPAVAAWVARVDKEAVRNTLLDMLEVGLIDESWCDRLSPEIAARLQELIDERHRQG
jgi:hypothetical protein